MNEYLKLAWRNIWRNKRRTLITTASIFFAIFFALIMRAFQLGSYSNMIDNAVQLYSGHIQIHGKGYTNNQSINNSFEHDDQLLNMLDENEQIKDAIPRIESFSLISSGKKTKGAVLMGINPEKQDEMSKLSDKIVNGSYMENGENSALISKTLSDFLQVTVNDTIVLLSQGYHGATAAGKYRVKGIVKIPKPDLDNKMVYLPLKAAQQMYYANNRLTTVSVNIYDPDKLQSVVNQLQDDLPEDKYEIQSWKEIMPELVQQIESDNASGWILLAILYIIIAFGVFGTVMMMIVERKKEFGVMIAVGMKKFKLSVIVALEMFFIGILGLVSGMVGSMPIILYLHYNPIRLTGELAETIEMYGIEPVLPLAWQVDYFINQFVIVALIVIVAILYPVYSITKIQPLRAMRD
ncbi:MAG: FtsX-like permease family protein [Bacteroidales bacterium]